MIKVSVIIPIYNVEKYLKRCIKSILKQTYTNLQIILVNDGSTDSSGQIISHFAAKDDRIEVINKPNGGLSDARNYGLKAVKGDYITFIDSDDFVTDDYVEYMVTLLEKDDADISAVGYSSFKENDPMKLPDISEQIFKYNSKEALEDLLYQKRISTSACAKLYRKDLFSDICFPKAKLYEDVSTIYKLFYKSKRIVQSSLQKYYYCIRNDSIVHSKFNPRKLDYVNNCHEILEFIDKVYPELHTAATSRFIWANIHVWVNIDNPGAYPDIYNNVKNNIYKCRLEVLRDSKVPRKVKLTILLTFLGWRISRNIYLLTK